MKLSELLWRKDLKEKFVLQKFLCTFLSCTREELRTDMDKELPDDIIQKTLTAYKSYVEDKRPIEYILGHVDFFDREFFVNEATLIPRPETEYMITAVTEYIQGQGNRGNGGGNILLDIGTWCGVLWISVLLQNPGYFSDAIFTDFYENALEVAKKNYANLVTDFSGNVQFIHSDLLDFLIHGNRELLDKNIVLVANLPYIPEKTFDENVADNVKNREPKPAFVWGDDGLDYYRIMLDQILSLIENWKLKIEKWFVMFLEMMTWQVDVLRQLYDDKFVFEEVKTFHFNIRIVKACLK